MNFELALEREARIWLLLHFRQSFFVVSYFCFPQAIKSFALLDKVTVGTFSVILLF